MPSVTGPGSRARQVTVTLVAIAVCLFSTACEFVKRVDLIPRDYADIDYFARPSERDSRLLELVVGDVLLWPRFDFDLDDADLFRFQFMAISTRTDLAVEVVRCEMDILDVPTDCPPGLLSSNFSEWVKGWKFEEHGLYSASLEGGGALESLRASEISEDFELTVSFEVKIEDGDQTATRSFEIVFVPRITRHTVYPT